MTSRFEFVKRYRMERPLACRLPDTGLPVGFQLVPWDDRLGRAHAETLHRSFTADCDGSLFPCLRTPEGCGELIRAIRAHPGFCAAATWLVTGPDGFAGTVQGLLAGHRFGAIQNIGVVPEHRGIGLGRVLLATALLGFQRECATRCHLEVTAANLPAVRLYRACGFRNSRVLYKAAARAEGGCAVARV